MPDFLNNIKWFRQSAAYINAHRNKTFVLMFDGDALLDENFDNLIQDIALLGNLGVRIVLVHGARPQIDTALKKLGIHSHFHNDLRVTDEAALLAVKAAVGIVKTDIEASLSMRLPNSPMHGTSFRLVSGNFVTAKPMGIIDGVDFQHTGEVRNIDTQAMNDVLDKQHMVLLSCCGYSPSGEVFNLAVEDVAQYAATAMGADKFILFSKTDGLNDKNDIQRRELTTEELKSWLPNLEAENLRQAQAAINAVEAGVKRAHIISYANEGALLEELFTRTGAGTLITQQEYEHFRSAKSEDISGILSLLQPLEEKGLLITRSQTRLEDDIDNFYVIERDGMITACAALYDYGKTAELACVAVHTEYQGDKRGQKILKLMEEAAIKAEYEKLFVLTTRTADWFIEQGFNEGCLEELPTQKQQAYNNKRNSKILFKTLK